MHCLSKFTEKFWYILRSLRFNRVFPEIQLIKLNKIKLIRNIENKKKLLLISKRTSPGTLSHRTNQGSMTIEAALLLPLFLFAVISILSFTEILRVQMKINSCLQQTAKELAVYAYAIKEGHSQDNSASSFSLDMALSEIYVRSRVSKELTGNYIKNSPIEGQEKMSFSESKFMDRDRIELRCSYYVMPFFSLSPKSGFQTESVAVARAFTGYDNTKITEALSDEKMVYITKTGHAYHSSRSCNYLDLSIQMMNKSQVENHRNSSGGRYKACPLCGNRGIGNVTYITDYGDRYHYDLLCSGLKRTIYTVPISEAGGRMPCGKCCGK